MNPETILITAANQGMGSGLISYILSQPEPPKFLFAGCTDPSVNNMKFLRAMAEKYSCLKLIPFDASIDENIDSAFNTTDITMEGEGLNLLINNAGVVDGTEGGLAVETRENMCSHFDTNATGKNN